MKCYIDEKKTTEVLRIDGSRDWLDSNDIEVGKYWMIHVFIVFNVESMTQ